MEDDVMAELAEVAELIASNEAERAELMHRRDLLVKRARDGGHKWVDIQTTARLSVRGVKIALDR